MSEPMYDIIKRLFEAKHEWAGVDIGPINGSGTLSLEQHAGFGSGTLVMRLTQGNDGEYWFNIEDFRSARQLAHGLLGWADVAEKLYNEMADEAAREEASDE